MPEEPEGRTPLKIGSVKTNIGHLESAAGVAGITKVLLMMKYGKMVKSLHFERPNPKINFPKYNMEVSTDVADWCTLEDGTRMTCVNSFGFGGTNSHAIIKQLAAEGVQEIREEDGRKYIVFLSALDNGGLANSLYNFAQCLRDTSIDSLNSIAYTSSCRREHFKYRVALVAEGKEELLKKADVQMKTISDVKPPGLNPPNIIFVFCGVGTTWTGMCKELLETEAEFKAAVLKVDTLLREYTSWSIYDKLKQGADLSNPLVGHLAIFTCQVGLTELWKYYGITPNVVIGQSVGEVAAAYASGALTLENAVKVIYHRSEILSRATGGSMFVVGNSDTEMVGKMCEEYDQKVNIAVYNSSVSCTVSGDIDVVNEMIKTIKTKSEEENNPVFLRVLNVKCAYHSHHTEKASKELEHALEGLTGNTPNVELMSTVTGEGSKPDQFVTNTYWKENVRQPVQFQQAVQNSAAPSTLNIFLEIGPKPVLKAHLSDSFNESKAVDLISMNVNSERVCIMESLAALYMYGIDLNMERINPYTSITSDIPKYIPNRMKSLFEADSTKLRKQGRNRLTSTHPFIKRQSDDETPFKIDISTSSTPYVYEHNVAGNILVPGAFYAEVGLEASKNLLEMSPFNLELAVEFYRPLRLSPGSPCEAFVILKSLEHGNNLTFNIQTGNDVIARGSSAKIQEDFRLSLVDVKKIRERCTIYHPKEKTYETLKILGFSYGEDLQILGNGYKNKNECLVDVTLSDLLMNDLNTTNLHPAVLDGLLQTPGIVQDLMDERPSGQLLPAGFGKLILRRAPEKNMLAYMNLKTFSKDEITYNLLLLQTDGIVVAEVKDFVIRSIEKSDRSNGDIAHKIVWTEIELCTGANSISTDLTQREEDEETISDKDKDCSFLCKSETEITSEESANSDTEKNDISKENISVDHKVKDRIFVFISRDKDTATSFKEHLDHDLDIIYYIPNDTTNIKEEILEKHFGKENVVEDKEICLLFATGHMEQRKHSGELLFDDIVNDCDILLTILRFMADKPEQIPMYVVTQSTQPIDIDCHMNLLGSQLWGLVRSVLREQSFKLYLVDVDPDIKNCITELLSILSGKCKQFDCPELAIRNGNIFQNEFVLQPYSERMQIPRIKSIDKHCIAEYRSILPDSLQDTFYSLQETDADLFSNSIKIKPVQACLHDKTLYPITFENAVGAVDLWPHDCKDGYGVLTFEVLGTRLDNEFKKVRANETFVACYPLKIQSVIKVPKSCVANVKDLPTYVPGMLRNATLLWDLVDKLPSKKSYCILTDDDHQSMALILKQMIASRRSGPVVVFKMHELQSPDQMTHVIIPLLKIDLRTVHGLVNAAVNTKVIASLRHFLPLQVERYVTARSPHINVIAVNVDEVLSKSRLPQIVPSVITWMKKQKYKLMAKDISDMEPSRAAIFGLPGRVVNVEMSSDISECDIRVPENLIFRKTAVYVVIGGLTGLGWELMKYLAEKGAGFIISLSRREPSNEKQAQIKELSERYGCYISTAQTDITNIVSLEETFEDILSEIPYPIKGIFQGAGVLDDALFVSMSKEKLQKVLMPKVLGTWNLHLVSRNLSLDYFFMHSSMTSVFGNAGQTNYGAANAFLDTLAHYRRNMGLSGQSINWGPLKVGMAINDDSLEQILERRGMFSLSIPAIRKCFLEALKNNSPQVTYGTFDWDTIAYGLESDDMHLVKHRFRGFVDRILEQRKAKRNVVQLNFDLNEIMSLSKENRMNAILEALIILASEVFGVEKSLLNEETLISALGVDSMLAMTFAQTVLKVMHAKISLVMLLTDGTTIQTLVESINNILENSGGEEEQHQKEIDPSVYNSMTPYEKRAYNGYLRNKYDPSLYMFGDVVVDSVIAMPEYWQPLIEKLHVKYPALRTLFIPGHDDIRYGVKRVILEPNNCNIDFRIVPKSLLQHKTRHPPNVDDYLFDPAQDLPMRVFYAKNGRRAIIRFLFNHLALDLNSISMIMKDLKPNAPVEDQVDAIDIAAHIERRLIDDEKQLRSFWDTVIPKDLKPMSLTTKGDISTDPNFFEFKRIEIPRKLVTDLKPILEANKCSLFQFFTTMFEILLHVELRQPTVSIMTTIDCRMFFPELKKEANRFTNRIPLFLQLNDSTMQVAEILQRNRTTIIESLEYGYLPFMDIISGVKDHPVNEIFRHQIVMEETGKISSLTIDNGKRVPLKVKKLQVGNYYNETIFYVWNDALTQKLELELGCSTLIIDEDRADNLLMFMVMMIERLVADPGITLEDMTSYKIFTPMVDSSITKSTGNRSNPKNKSMYYYYIIINELIFREYF